MRREFARNGLVDGMRGVAILLVLILHFHIAYGLNQGSFATLFSAEFMRALARNGNYGVTIFFVISGFLITATSLARFGRLRDVRLRDFYSFRFARIAPNLALIVTVVVALALAGIPIFANKTGTASMGVTVLSLVTFTHNLLMQKFGYFNYCLNVLWSLSVEEMFYFTFPLVCVLLRRDRLILAFWALVALFGPIHRAHYRDNEIVALYGYFSCFDAIAIGCIAAVLRPRFRLSETARLWSRYAAIAVIVFVYFQAPIMQNVVFGVSVVALSTGWILAGIEPSGRWAEPAGNIVAKWLGWVGKHSYELYLFHVVVLALMRTVVARDGLGYFGKPLWFGLFLSASLALAGCISRFYSEPMNRMLRGVLARADRRRPVEVAISG